MIPSANAGRRGPPAIFWLLVLASIVTIAAGAWGLLIQQDRAASAERTSSAPPVSAALAQSVAPEFALPNLAGDEVRLGDLRGQVVLLNFWATWCPPCEAEMPDLNTLHSTYGAAHKFMVLGVNMEEAPAAVQAFVDARRITFPILLDEQGEVSAHLYTVRSLPMSLIIDRDGKIRDAWTGRVSKEAMLARLEQVW